MLSPTLAAAAHQAGRRLTPPRWLTPGDLPGALAGAPGRLAGPIARRLAWMSALRSVPLPDLEPLVPHPPARDRLERWSAIAEQLERASDELAGDLITFADVPRRAGGLIDDVEGARWSAAAHVQRAYEADLAAYDLIDEPLGWARTIAAAAPSRLRVILIATPELPEAAVASLRLAASVTALVAAPEALADRFDALGRIIPARWLDAQIDIPEGRVIVADGPREQAAHALAALAGAAVNPSDTAIGVPDAEVAYHIQRLAGRTGVLAVRPPAGRRIADTAPALLLRAVADHLEERTLATLGALARHPEVEQWLRRGSSDSLGPEWWLAALDDYATASLRSRIEDQWPEPTDRSGECAGEICFAVDRLLQPLRADSKPAPDWASPLRDLLATVYERSTGARSGPVGPILVESAQRIGEGLRQLAAAPVRPGDTLAAAQAIRLVLDSLGDSTLTPLPDPGAIEMLGWLELPFDPASTVIVTGMNEEHFGGAGSDPLLPDALRRVLGTSHADRRHARDIYLMSGLLASRPRLTLIAGRRSGNDDPLRPSRLLLAAAPDVLLVRLRTFFDGRQSSSPPEVHVGLRPGPVNRFRRCPRIAFSAPGCLSVTAFRDYLHSPYLFYLTRILGLKQRDVPPQELDPLSYGNLMHEVLRQFGRSDDRHSTDPASIRDFLNDALTAEANGQFGARRAGAVELQLALLRLRLSSFARRQADWRSKGWRIERTEWPERGRAVPFLAGASPINLSGRIDRIDRHDDGRVAILDYKSGNRVHPPEKTHRGRAGWKDLQLPLYRHLAAELGLPDDPTSIVFGYFAVPSNPEETGILPAGWSAPDLDSADTEARRIIQAIRDGGLFELGRAAPDEWVFEILTGLTYPDSDEDVEEAPR